MRFKRERERKRKIERKIETEREGERDRIICQSNYMYKQLALGVLWKWGHAHPFLAGRALPVISSFTDNI